MLLLGHMLVLSKDRKMNARGTHTLLNTIPLDGATSPSFSITNLLTGQIGEILPAYVSTVKTRKMNARGSCSHTLS